MLYICKHLLGSAIQYIHISEYSTPMCTIAFTYNMCMHIPTHAHMYMHLII